MKGFIAVLVLSVVTLTGCASSQRPMESAAAELVQSNTTAVVYVNLASPIKVTPKSYHSAAVVGVFTGGLGAVAVYGMEKSVPDTAQAALDPYDPVLNALTPALNDRLLGDVQSAVDRSPLLTHARFIRAEPIDKPDAIGVFANHTGTPVSLVIVPQAYFDRDGEEIHIELHVQLWSRDAATGQPELAYFTDSNFTGYLPIQGLVGGHSDWRRAVDKLSMEQCLASWFAHDAADLKAAISEGEASAIARLTAYVQATPSESAGAAHAGATP